MPVIETSLGPVYPGVWLGKVVKVDDSSRSQRTGKCKVSIPDVYGDNIPSDELPWAYPIFPTPLDVKKRAGFFSTARKGMNVAVLFERGDPQSPRWLGGWSPKGRLPFPFTDSEGDKFPNIQCWRGVDGMMIRFVEGERMEFYLGESGSFQDGEFQKDGQHSQYDSFIKLDKKRKKVEIRLKYDVDIRCKGKITISAPQIQIRVMPNRTQGSDGSFSNDPDSPKPKWELSVFDPDAQQGARITAEPGKLQGRARSVKGFKDR